MKNVNEIINNAAYAFRSNNNPKCISFADYVSAEFWKTVGKDTQTHDAQELYCNLADIGFTPLERFQ